MLRANPVCDLRERFKKIKLSNTGFIEGNQTRK